MRTVVIALALALVFSSFLPCGVAPGQERDALALYVVGEYPNQHPIQSIADFLAVVKTFQESAEKNAVNPLFALTKKGDGYQLKKLELSPANLVRIKSMKVRVEDLGVTRIADLHKIRVDFQAVINLIDCEIEISRDDSFLFSREGIISSAGIFFCEIPLRIESRPELPITILIVGQKTDKDLAFRISAVGFGAEE